MITVDDHESHLAFVSKVSKAAVVRGDEQPTVVLAASGMCAGGRVVNYLEFDGQRYDIEAGIHALSGYSAHAGKQDLINFVKRMHGKPKEVRIIHGDEGGFGEAVNRCGT